MLTTEVIILMGVPGSGKTRYTKRLALSLEAGRDLLVHCSADNYHIYNGEYRWTAEMAGRAHKMCLLRFIEALRTQQCPWADNQEDIAGPWAPKIEPSNRNVIIVDNTNTTAVQIAPYIEIANAYDVKVRVVHIKADPDKALARCVHSVPAAVHRTMTFQLGELLDKWPSGDHDIDGSQHWPEVETVEL